MYAFHKTHNNTYTNNNVADSGSFLLKFKNTGCSLVNNKCAWVCRTRLTTVQQNQ